MGRRILENRLGTTTSFVLILVCLMFAGVLGVLLLRGSNQGESHNVLITRGMSLRQVAELLHNDEVIEYPMFIRICLRLSGGNTRVRAGEFQFQKHMRTLDAIWVLYRSEPVVYTVTIPEGITLRQIAHILTRHGLGSEKKFLDLTLTKQAALKHHFSNPSLEGFLFPDTYVFSKIDGEEKIVERMVEHFIRKYEKEYKEDIHRLGWPVEKVLTLASIVEKETGRPEERPIIASVFLNRLKKRMRLQSDPTTIYGIDNFNGNLTKKDLLRPSPYNTYTLPGLPAGPIANPGDASIKAVLHPAQTDFLYFVSNNRGSHLFSKTYLQHSRYVNALQKSLVRTSKPEFGIRTDTRPK